MAKRGRPRKVLVAGDLPVDRSEWYPEHWEEYLTREGLGMDAGELPRNAHCRLVDNYLVTCGECIGAHTHEAGCTYYDGEDR